jgi:hypothetical protein
MIISETLFPLVYVPNQDGRHYTSLFVLIFPTRKTLFDSIYFVKDEDWPSPFLEVSPCKGSHG